MAKKNPFVRRMVAKLVGGILVQDAREEPEALGLVSPDTVLAIRPQFADDSDKAKAKGLSQKGQAATKRARIIQLDAEATALEESGDRKVDAADNFRTATGNKH
jgi:hypothetical protein